MRPRVAGWATTSPATQQEAIRPQMSRLGEGTLCLRECPRNKLENKNLQQISAAISARSAIFQKRLKKEHYCKRLKSSALKGNYASFSRLYKKNKCNDKKLFWSTAHACSEYYANTDSYIKILTLLNNTHTRSYLFSEKDIIVLRLKAFMDLADGCLDEIENFFYYSSLPTELEMVEMIKSDKNRR